jgi:sugar/nucleoside kinase (ribokinase family)
MQSSGANRSAGGRRPHVVVVGGACVDTLLKSSLSTAKDMMFTSTPASLLQRSVGGVGWNIARNVTRRFPAIDVTFCTVVGDDPSGGYVREELEKEAARSSVAGGNRRLHVSLHGVPGLPTASYIAMLGSDGELAAAAAVMEIFDKGLRPEVMSIDTAQRPVADVLVLDGNVASTTGALIAAPPAGCRVVAIDPISKAKMRRLSPVLKACGPRATVPVVMKPNEFEAEALAVDLGLAVADTVDDSAKAVSDMCARILDALPAVHALLCTRGAKGVVIVCRYSTRERAPEGWRREPSVDSVVSYDLPAAPLHGRKVVKVTGAGDAFFSAVVATLAHLPAITPAALAEASRMGCEASRDIITAPPSKL